MRLTKRQVTTMTSRQKRNQSSALSGGPRKSTKRVEQSDEVMEGDDDNSVNTAKQGNGKKTTVENNFVTFLLLRTTVPQSKKGTETMKGKFSELMKILQDADESCGFSIYQSDPIVNDNDKYSTNANNLITQAKNMPDSITALSKYFYGARPYSKGGTIWSQIRLMHNSEIENIIADTKYDLNEKNIFLTKQTIQHWNVESIGFLKNLHPEVDTLALTEFLNESLPKYAQAKNVYYGLKVKTPYDGQRREKFVEGNIKSFKNRLQAVHVEVEGTFVDTAIKCLKNILTSKAFRQRYTSEVRLIPNFDRRASPHTQEKIKRCIVQHGQFCKCVKVLACSGIDHIDQINSKLKRTLRDLIVNMDGSHFINIDKNWRGDCYQILYPIKYEKEAKDRIAHLGAYLHHVYGADVLLSLPAETQEEIHDTIWDEEKDRPVSKLERELDEVLEAGDIIEFVDMSLVTEETSKTTATSPISSKFVPVLDTCSISTFSTTPGATNHSNSISNSIALKGDSQTTVSDVTIESKISRLEEGYLEIRDTLKLIAKEVVSKEPSKLTQTNKSLTAELSPDNSAATE